MAVSENEKRLYESAPDNVKPALQDAIIAKQQAAIHQKSGDKKGMQEAGDRVFEAMGRANAAMRQSSHDMNSDVPHPMTKKGQNH